MSLHDRRWLLLAGLAASLCLSGCTNYIDPYLADVLIGVGISIILAVSLDLVNGHTGQFSLGHAGFMALGAYASAWLTMSLPALFDPDAAALPRNAGFLLALLLGGFTAALAGLAVGLPSLRLKGDYLALVTLGFGEIIRVLLQNCEPLGGALGLVGIPPCTTLPWTAVMVCCCIYTVWTLTSSAQGLAFHAVRDDELAAASMGLDTTRIKVSAFVIGAFFAGIAGGLFAHLKLAIDPRGFDFSRSVEIVVMVVLGGMGRTLGVVLAAIILTILPEFLRGMAEYRMVIYSLVLILMMLLRPQGLLGLRRFQK